MTQPMNTYFVPPRIAVRERDGRLILITALTWSRTGEPLAQSPTCAGLIPFTREEVRILDVRRAN